MKKKATTTPSKDKRNVETPELLVREKWKLVMEALIKLNELARPVIARQGKYLDDEFYPKFKEQYETLQVLVEKIDNKIQIKYPDSFLGKTWNWVKDVMKRLKGVITGEGAKLDSGFQILTEINQTVPIITSLIKKAKLDNKLQEEALTSKIMMLNELRNLGREDDFPKLVTNIWKAVQEARQAELAKNGRNKFHGESDTIPNFPGQLAPENGEKDLAKKTEQNANKLETNQGPEKYGNNRGGWGWSR